MSGLGYTWQSITWRVVGLALTGVLFYFGLFKDEPWSLVVAFAVFVVSWFTAAWLDDAHPKDVR